jgi:hypothetical protein
LIALGYCAGALGPDDVIAVCAPGLPNMEDLAEFVVVRMDSGDIWRRELTTLLERAGCTAPSVLGARS